MKDNFTNDNQITILHLSDFHFSEENRAEIQSILDAILRDLKDLNEKYNVIPNLVVISGDVANTGDKKDYEFALRSLKELFDQLKIPSNNVFIVPGNHDVNRNELKEFGKITFNDENSITKFLTQGEDEMEATFKKLNNFYDFIERFYGDNNPYRDNYYLTTTIQVGEKKIGIVGLNTSWFSGERRFKENGNDIVVDEKALIVGVIQAKNAYEAINKLDYCITIMHHPFSWLNDFDEGIIKRIVMQNSNIILHGHIHSSSATETIEPDSRCISLSAGASYTKNRTKRYNVCKINLDDSSYELYLRIYSDENKFWARDTLTYQLGEGIIKGKLSGDEIGFEGLSSKEYPFGESEPAIENFVRLNWKKIISPDGFNKRDMLKLRRQFFKKSDLNPSLHDIAYATIRYLLENRMLRSKRDLEKKIQNQFIDEQIHDFEKEKILSYFDDDYFDKQHEEIVFTSKSDIAQLKDREFLAKKENEIAQKYKKKLEKDLKKKEEDLEKAKREIESEYEKFKSTIEDYPNLSEEGLPELKKPTRVSVGKWYEELGLRENPFPSHIGLEKIKEELYDNIIVKTDIFYKFGSEIIMSDLLLRKNFLIYGAMGSGKTTLFKYLQKTISILKPNTFTIYIPLESQSEFERIRYDFYQKLYEHLEKFYFSKTNYPTGIEKTTINDSTISSLFEQLSQITSIDNFIIFIDDLHKHPKYMKEVFEFISGLQIFRAYMYENDINLSIFLAGDLTWISDTDGVKAIGGSIDSREKIPEITTDDAVEMINKRLEVYAINPEKPPTIKQEYVEKIFKILRARLPMEITFRDVIEELEKHWTNYEFESLQLSVILDSNTLSNMMLDMEADHPSIKSKFDRILEYSEKDEGVFNQFTIIMDNLYLTGGMYEDTPEFESYSDYYGHLFRIGLISRQHRGRSFVWGLTKEVRAMVQKFEGKYGFKPSEYLSKLYLTEKEKYFSEESSRMSMLLKTGGTYGELFLRHIKEALDTYRLIFRYATSIQEECDFQEIRDICKKSINSLMKATVIVCENKDIKTELFYDVYEEFVDSWFENIELTEFVDTIQKKEAKEPALDINDIRTICRDYLRAVKSLVSNIQRFMKHNSIFLLDSKYIHVRHKKTLNSIRRNFYNENYSLAVEKINLLIAQKLRDLTYIVNCLIYGLDKWRRGIPKEINKKLKGPDHRTFREKGILNKLNLFELTGIYQNLDYITDKIIRALFGDENWDTTYKIIFLDEELQMITSNSKIDRSKEETLRYILQAKNLIEKIDSFYYLFFMNKIPFNNNYRDFGISYDKLGEKCRLDSCFIKKEVVNRIKAKIDKDIKIELNLGIYIPNQSFQDLNFLDWMVYIYKMKCRNEISISIAPNGNVIIS